MFLAVGIGYLREMIRFLKCIARISVFPLVPIWKLELTVKPK